MYQMTAKFLEQMTSRGYTEAEALEQWNLAMGKAEGDDPIYATVAEMHPDEATARESYAITQIEGLPVKTGGGAPQISSNPLVSDTGGASGGTSGSNLPATTGTTARSSTQSSKYIAPSIDSLELRKQMNDTVTALLSEKKDKTANTSIAKVLVKTPDPSSFLKVNGVPKTVTISTAMDKITKFESENHIEQKPENVAAYNELKAAADSKTKVPVYINDENNRRIIGVVLDTIDSNGGKTTRILSAKDLEAFLLGEVSGIVTNGQAYVRLANWKRKIRMEGGIPVPSITLTIQWTKKGYFWDNEMVDFVAAPMTQAQATEVGVPSPFESRTVKTDLSFTVIEPNPNPLTKAKTPHRKRKIRLSGTCEEYPRFKIKPEYEASGISIGSSGSYVSPNMSTAEAAVYDGQFHQLVQGYIAGDNFSQMDAIAKVAPGAYERITMLRQSARELAAAGTPGA